MKQIRISRSFAAAAICLLLLAGCAPPVEEPVVTEVKPEKPVITKVEPEEQIPEVPAKQAVAAPAEEPVMPEVEPEKEVPKPPEGEAITLELKFTPQDSTTYKVITEGQRSVQFEGDLAKDTALKGGQTGNKVEMVFTQQIQSVDDKGNAVAKITIKGLKYLAKVKDDTVLDFDSSREENQNNPLAKLIGQSYTIEITPAGQVAAVIDVKEAQAAVRGSTSAHKRALALLESEAIKERHTISTLAVADKSQLHAGDTWSSIKDFSFGLMGARSYEKIYTLKEVKDIDGRQVAIVEMNAIPTSETAEQLHKEQQTSDFSNMFDSTQGYTGQLKLDLTNSKVEKYLEKLQLEWIIVDPSAEQKGDTEPDTLKMAATRLYSLEKID